MSVVMVRYMYACMNMMVWACAISKHMERTALALQLSSDLLQALCQSLRERYTNIT
jgi:hypothetical protein